MRFENDTELLNGEHGIWGAVQPAAGGGWREAGTVEPPVAGSARADGARTSRPPLTCIPLPDFFIPRGSFLACSGSPGPGSGFGVIQRTRCVRAAEEGLLLQGLQRERIWKPERQRENRAQRRCVQTRATENQRQV